MPWIKERCSDTWLRRETSGLYLQSYASTSPSNMRRWIPGRALLRPNPAEWEKVMAVDLTGTFNVTRLAIPHPKKSSAGVIINMSSIADRFGYANRSPYSTAKWGLIGVTKTLSIELGEYWHPRRCHPAGRGRRPSHPASVRGAGESERQELDRCGFACASRARLYG